MPDIASISAALASVKAATEIAKLIKNANISLADAETKLKIAELISTLADVKLEFAEIQDLLREKDKEIQALKQSIEKKQAMKYDGTLYWQEGDEIPFCTVCYEKNGKNHHLTYSPADAFDRAYYLCKVCRNIYHQ